MLIHTKWKALKATALHSNGPSAITTRINGNAIAAMASFCVICTCYQRWQIMGGNCMHTSQMNSPFRCTPDAINNNYMCTGLCEIRIWSVIYFHSVVMKTVALVQDLTGTRRVSWENDTICKYPYGSRGLPAIGLLRRLAVNVDQQSD